MDEENELMETPFILNGKFYKIISKSDNKVVTQCQHCPSQIQGNVTSTGNFIRHLKRKHPSTFTKFEADRTTKTTKRIKTENPTSTNDINKTSIFQRTQTITQDSVNILVLDYIAEEMRPICTVEKPAFVRLVEGLSGKKPCDRKTLKHKLEERKTAVVGNVREELNKAKYVCTTADVWSSNNKSYLGMTAHYIENSSFERKSFVLSCRRFKFSHTFDKIAEMISQIHSEYNLGIHKISGTVTDNASNFSKAFNVFASFLTNDKYNGLTELHNQNDVDVEPLPDFDMDTTYVLLPQHFKCCSHTLSLIITVDALAATENTRYKKINDSVFQKVFSLWNLVSRSTKASDEVENICGIKLKVPCPTRWNSMYDACIKLISIESKLNEICKVLKINEFQQSDFMFLKEHIFVTKPLAISIDILQNEKSCHLGTVLPTLFLKLKHHWKS